MVCAVCLSIFLSISFSQQDSIVSISFDIDPFISPKIELCILKRYRNISIGFVDKVD